MLSNLVLWLTGLDEASNTTKCLPVDDVTAMDAALRAIAANPPLRVTMLTGGRAAATISADQCKAMVPTLPPLPPAPSPGQQLDNDFEAIAKADLSKLKGDAKLCHDLCDVLVDFAKDGGALETVKQMASQLRQYQAAANAVASTQA